MIFCTGLLFLEERKDTESYLAIIAVVRGRLFAARVSN